MQQDQQAAEERLTQRLEHKATSRMRKKHRPMRVSGKSVFTLKALLTRSNFAKQNLGGLTKKKK